MGPYSVTCCSLGANDVGCLFSLSTYQEQRGHIASLRIVVSLRVMTDEVTFNLVIKEFSGAENHVLTPDEAVPETPERTPKIVRESPLSFVEDSSMVEPLGGCGKKVMMWWLRSEARAYSKFPVGYAVIWTIDMNLLLDEYHYLLCNCLGIRHHQCFIMEKVALGGADAIFGMHIAFYNYHNAYDHI
ncbi:glycosyl transferase, family 43, nucleotide-diphospho-sugar transferase [Artemisia annua]|uniref:Glycosyl transferase, family 43, nucleotide-diphospho-sugar transferase n=1 Tax=Artemisia annua TaxID=35608 RepID=A0A2U1Q200_ARTAN|nr:glycosyl transferase, family 43, nucleotide-diphospho-sugar transferase [Artemisia annua]